MSNAYARFGPAAAPAWGQNWLLAASVLAGFTLLLGLWVLGTIRLGVTIQTTGLIIHGWVRSRFIPWGEIAGISYSQEHVTWLPVWRYSWAYLWLNQGPRISLGDLISSDDLPECVTRMKAEIYTRLETTSRFALRTGKGVGFGLLRLQQTGLGIPEWGRLRFLTWQQIEHIEVDQGRLFLNLTAGKKRSFPIGKIPNFEIFLALIRETEKIR